LRKEKTTVLLALLLIFGMTAVVFVVPSVASASAGLPDYEPLDVGPSLGMLTIPSSSWRAKMVTAEEMATTPLY
jgi:hypothetical protein